MGLAYWNLPSSEQIEMLAKKLEHGALGIKLRVQSQSRKGKL